MSWEGDTGGSASGADETAIENAIDRDGMTLELHKALARAAIGIWSTGDVARAGEIFAPDYAMHQHHDHDPDGSGGLVLEPLLAFLAEFRKAFPDLEDRIDLQLAEGDLVATRFTSTGTQTGPLQGLPATGRRASWTGTVIDRVRDGRIVESWGNWDMMGMMQQLGAAKVAGAADPGR
jgi:steroid delta-isomerase-like uncharacterized protein